MQWNFQDIHNQAQAEAQAINSPQAMEAFRLKYLGKKGLVAAVFASLGAAQPYRCKVFRSKFCQNPRRAYRYIVAWHS